VSFSERVIGILNGGALNVALGLGYRLGLFEALDAFQAPASLSQIAEATSLDPRYVREWLGVVACGDIVEVHGAGEDERFSLPPAHGDVLCRRAGTANLGVYTQELPLLTESALSRVRDGFRSGEGLDYACYEEFFAFMGELADAKHERTLVDGFLPSVAEGAIVAQLEAGARACDVGCGSGAASILMARAFPRSEFVGVDFDRGAIETARRGAEAARLQNLRFLERDAAALHDDQELQGGFDYVTSFDAIHDQTQPLAALRGIRALLAPGGVFSMVDIAAESSIGANREHAMGSFLYAVSLLHCMPVGLGAEGSGAGLGMLWGRERALALLAEAGFAEVEVHEIPNDPFNLHYLCRASAGP
jgi:2-polyprenyl-3-methyl-5-hydroxy-6-metoxy-1,4-benzoquinol methylase